MERIAQLASQFQRLLEGGTRSHLVTGQEGDPPEVEHRIGDEQRVTEPRRWATASSRCASARA